MNVVSKINVTPPHYESSKQRCISRYHENFWREQEASSQKCTRQAGIVYRQNILSSENRKIAASLDQFAFNFPLTLPTLARQDTNKENLRVRQASNSVDRTLHSLALGSRWKETPS